MWGIRGERLAREALSAGRAGPIGHEVAEAAVRATLHALGGRRELRGLGVLLGRATLAAKDPQYRDDPDDSHDDEGQRLGRLIHRGLPDSTADPVPAPVPSRARKRTPPVD